MGALMTKFLLILANIFFVLLESQSAFAESWKYIYCFNQENNNFIELDLSLDHKLNLATNESIYLIYRMDCEEVSTQGPFAKCASYASNESRTFNSYSQITNGFSKSYSDEVKNETYLFFVFKRDFVDSDNSYKSLTREFKFKVNQCVWE